MRLERTFDAELVRSVIGHPKLKPLLIEGDDVPVPMHESIYYFAIMDERHADGAIEDVLVGVVGFVPVNNIAWNPHIAILPEHRGCGTEALSLALDWMFANSPCEKIVAYPPAYNRRMIRVFEKCGLQREGYSPRSFRFNGVLHDRVLMGREKHERD